MLEAARHLLCAERQILLRESLGLAGLCVTILGGLFLPLVF